MSEHYRAACRRLVKEAVLAEPYFSGITEVSAWANGIPAESLPAFGVATPDEAPQISANSESQRVTTLTVVLKRLGGDEIEDRLDADSLVLERVVLQALRRIDRLVETSNVKTKVDGGAERRVGTLTIGFRITVWIEDPGLG